MSRGPGVRKEEAIAFRESVVSTALEQSGWYRGSALLLAPATGVAESLGVSLPKLYRGRIHYPDLLADASGLEVIHNGIVLGRRSGVTNAPPPEQLELSP